MDAARQPVLRTDPLTPVEPATRAALERSLGHAFRDPALLATAITHASAGQGRADATDNERLEFLGDRVLGLVIADVLMKRFPRAPEGELGRRLTALVQRSALAEVARSIDLGEHLVLAAAHAASGARTNPKLLADACEAVIAALYLDGGLAAAAAFIARAWESQLGQVAALPPDPKTALQEWAQGRGKPLPLYRVVSAVGEAHSPLFEIEVEVEGQEPSRATGATKRAAEKAAATLLLQRLSAVRS